MMKRSVVDNNGSWRPQSLTKTKKSPEFDDIHAEKLTLRRVSIPDAAVDTDDDYDLPVFLDNIPGKDKKLKATSIPARFGAYGPNLAKPLEVVMGNTGLISNIQDNWSIRLS
ncbi:hypothetical protein BG000_004499 [Podila horticola]|nr:hypothetical protein BG000_004499 [Podila horticola]